MNNFKISETTALFIQNIGNNSEYLVWADNTPITVEEIQNEFFVQELENGQFNLEHNTDDFRVENIEFNTEKNPVQFQREDFMTVFSFDPCDQENEHPKDATFKVFFNTGSDQQVCCYVIESGLISYTFNVETGE